MYWLFVKKNITNINLECLESSHFLDFIYQNTILFYFCRLFVHAKNIVVKEKPLSLHYTFTNTSYNGLMPDLHTGSS